MTGDLVGGGTDPEVAQVFAAYPQPVRQALLTLRELILDTAAATDGVGALEEALRWGQPSYLTTATGSGSTIRIGPAGPDSGHDYGVYFICRTSLVVDFRTMFGEVFDYEKDRALLFDVDVPVPEAELRECVAMALTYHLSKRR